ncbi:hypothetical protein [Acididesulfobacillus acetoxydans]|uniref:hypothetical protein n=1 Tax=Acididesulfobacillus acetoxydans TaxID=1561005 RepID=UPI001F0CFD6D|nr:hypothetical protein [Acididesulfobacillus acetoxydans]
MAELTCFSTERGHYGLGGGERTRVGIVPRLGAPPSRFNDVMWLGRGVTLGIAAAVEAAETNVAEACATIMGDEVSVESFAAGMRDLILENGLRNTFRLGGMQLCRLAMVP